MGEYARHEHHEFAQAVDQALVDEPLQKALARLTGTLLAGNRRGYASLADSDELRDRAKRIKEHTLAHLDEYLEQLEQSVLRRGGQVHWAATAADARRLIVQIAQERNCKQVVKSKSMTSEEVHLNPALESAGIEVTETDFGEFILQVAGERPSHLVAPAVHHTRESVARVLSAYVGETLPPDAQKLAMVGRRVLRDKFRNCGYGHHRRQLCDRRDRIDRSGDQRRERPPDDHLSAHSRRSHGDGEGHSATWGFAGFLEAPGQSSDGANIIGVHDRRHRPAS